MGATSVSARGHYFFFHCSQPEHHAKLRPDKNDRNDANSYLACSFDLKPHCPRPGHTRAHPTTKATHRSYPTPHKIVVDHIGISSSPAASLFRPIGTILPSKTYTRCRYKRNIDQNHILTPLHQNIVGANWPTSIHGSFFDPSLSSLFPTHNVNHSTISVCEQKQKKTKVPVKQIHLPKRPLLDTNIRLDPWHDVFRFRAYTLHVNRLDAVLSGSQAAFAQPPVPILIALLLELCPPLCL